MRKLKFAFFVVLFASVTCNAAVATYSMAFGKYIDFSGITIMREHLEEVDSTFAYSMEKQLVLKEQPRGWRLVTTTKQTKGVGTCGRKWLSDNSENIFASLSIPVILPKDGLDKFRFIPYEKIATVAVYDELKKLFKSTHQTVDLIWPNDVKIAGKKIAGVNIGYYCFDSGCFQITIGIGINIGMTQEFLSSIDQPATSLSVELKKVFSPKDIDGILRDVLLRTIQTVVIYEKEGKDLFLKSFLEKIASASQTVNFSVSSDVTLTGKIVGFSVEDHVGAFIVQKETGESVLLGIDIEKSLDDIHLK